ncbi:MAG: hypothetical protein IPM76_15435 [Chloroflexi bacterium]|nr:hypothetical protein [Chloroflexota bacterium]
MGDGSFDGRLAKIKYQHGGGRRGKAGRAEQRQLGGVGRDRDGDIGEAVAADEVLGCGGGYWSQMAGHQAAAGVDGADLRPKGPMFGAPAGAHDAVDGVAAQEGEQVEGDFVTVFLGNGAGDGGNGRTAVGKTAVELADEVGIGCIGGEG